MIIFVSRLLGGFLRPSDGPDGPRTARASPSPTCLAAARRYPPQVPRSYTLVTIKTLFGEARACAFPGCDEGLIFRDRGVASIIAEIAHIRSERPGGPRHDPTYTGDINGADNLLLLCGRHHRPVDRHESLYTIAELEIWKADQIAAADGGTPISDSEARAYARLTDAEQQILRNIARHADQVSRACRAAHEAMDAVRAENEEVRLAQAYKLPPLHELNDDGSRGRMINSDMELPWVEQQKWSAKIDSARDQETTAVKEALGQLSGEVAVLHMIDAPLGNVARVVLRIAEVLPTVVGDSQALDTATRQLEVTVSMLWQIANGQIDFASA